MKSPKVISSFRISSKGLSTLRKLAQKMGYTCKRKEKTEGSISQLLEAIADGSLSINCNRLD